MFDGPLDTEAMWEARDRFYDEHEEVPEVPTCGECLWLYVPDEKWFGKHEFGFCPKIEDFTLKSEKVDAILCEEYFH